MTALSLWQSSVTITCCNCSIAFAVPGEFNAKRLKDRELFWCPAGHPQHYSGKTEEQKLKEQLESSQRRAAQLEEDRAQAYRQVESERRATAAQKANVTKLKRRAEAGVCAHCNRTFLNVARHMKTKHAAAGT